MKTKQQQQQYLKISQDSLQAILDYLGKQPFNEVYPLINSLQNAEPIEEEKSNKEETPRKAPSENQAN